MALESKEKQKIIKKYGKNDKDTGATEVQVALLTSQIRSLTCLLYTSPSPRD